MTNVINKLIDKTVGQIFNKLHMEKNWNLAGTYGNLWKREKGFSIAETEQKLSTSGFSWLKLCGNCSVCFRTAETGLNITHQVSAGGIHLKLYNSFRIAVTIQETSSQSFYIVLAVFQFCWNCIFHPVIFCCFRYISFLNRL